MSRYQVKGHNIYDTKNTNEIIVNTKYFNEDKELSYCFSYSGYNFPEFANALANRLNEQQKEIEVSRILQELTEPSRTQILSIVLTIYKNLMTNTNWSRLKALCKYNDECKDLFYLLKECSGLDKINIQNLMLYAEFEKGVREKKMLYLTEQDKVTAIDLGCADIAGTCMYVTIDGQTEMYVDVIMNVRTHEILYNASTSNGVLSIEEK